MNKSHESPDSDDEMAELSYSDYESSASDERDPSPDSSKQVLTDGFIAGNNMTPEVVSELLKQGASVKLLRSPRDEVPLIALFLLSVVLTLYITAVLPESYSGFPFQIFLPLVILALLLHRRWNAKYFIEADGVTYVTGFLLWNLSRIKCDYEKMKAIEVHKNLLQRLFNVGDVGITTIRINYPEMAMLGVPNPYFYQQLIQLQLQEDKEEG